MKSETMPVHADKKDKDQHAQVANEATVQSLAITPGFQFEDHRTAAVVQRKMQETIQNNPPARPFHGSSIKPFQLKENRTGLPDQLKSGVEHLSGLSLDDVQVHYNSNQPAQFQAYAFAQGSQIHLAPGQEKHLPHEAWHVVQQKQGRVQATTQLRANVLINDDVALEREADVMGARAFRLAPSERGKTASTSLQFKTRQAMSGFAVPFNTVGNTPHQLARSAWNEHFSGSHDQYPQIKAPTYSVSGNAPIQMISEVEARQRLGAEMGQNEAVAILIDLNFVRDEIPKVETALAGFAGFINTFPQKPKTRDPQYLSKKRVRDLLEPKVNDLSNKLSTFVEVLESIEDWYIDAALPDRDREAKQNLKDWKMLRSKFEGAATLISGLFESKPKQMGDLENPKGVETIALLRDEIRMWFQSAGGFSAIGRANEIKAEIKPADPDADRGFPADEHFLSGYYQGSTESESIVEGYQVTKEQQNIVSTGPSIVMGEKITILPSAPDANLPQRMTQTEAGMKALSPATWKVDFKAPPAPQDRGVGQYANMNRTNARGYAWLSAAKGWATTGWEWLHVRAASLGGATDGTNLVLGTRDANTLMMPFESNIRLLAGLVKEYPALNRLSVDWSVESNGQQHGANTIKITWTLIPNGDANDLIKGIAEKASGEIVVPTMDTGTNLSKTEVKFVEDELSKFRKLLRGEEEL